MTILHVHGAVHAFLLLGLSKKYKFLTHLMLMPFHAHTADRNWRNVGSMSQENSSKTWIPSNSSHVHTLVA